MPPASPRKSSTSSGRPERPRARYLGVEAAGEPVPSRLPPWGLWLHDALVGAGVPGLSFRLIRSEGPRAVIRVAREDAAVARRAWNTARTPSGSGPLRTLRTWGTLVGAKAWVAAAERGRPGAPERTPRR
jgi:hypothetical protein